MLSLSVLLTQCKHQKKKTIYKPGHIPEFENPENEESDTYYGLNSSKLFPDREKGRVNKSAFEEHKEKEQRSKSGRSPGSLAVSGTPKSDDVQHGSKNLT
ncbi:hypothetical protein Q1695_001739 [Nippostrongylus brasiliensis]|nr:hypothetical protein Q1695_001739 [Nippostrongylus brasiliensis]